MLSLSAIAALAFWGSVRAEQVEVVIGLDVSNPRAFVSAMDTMFESGAMDGYDLTIWANAFDGSNPASHTLVASFDSYEDYLNRTRQRLDHKGWSDYLLAIDDMSNITSTGFAVELYRQGEVSAEHRSGVAFIMTVTDPARYAPELVRLTEAVGHPGSIRLMQMRFGGMGATHVVLLGAPDAVAMNEYLDTLLSSDAYKGFVDEVGEIRTIRTVNSYAAVKRWEK